MTVGIRNPPHQNRNAVNTLSYFPMMQGQSAAGKSQYGNRFVDEQTVPQALYQPKIDSYKDLQQDFMSMDPLAPYNQWYNSQNYNTYNNFMAYPMYQPTYDMSSAIQGNEHATLRQNSIPNGSLDQYLDNSSFDYEQVLENLDLSQYENPESFSLEDYANLEQVNEGMNFDVVVKQEKVEDITDGKNPKEMENLINNNTLNTIDPMVGYGNSISIESPVTSICGNAMNITDDQTLDDQNLMEILEFYSSPNSGEWQTPSTYSPTSNQVTAVSGEAVIKTEPSDTIQSSCEFSLSDSPFSNCDEGVPTIGVSDDELIQMPVSRFNELLLSLTPEQSNLAKDIRRRGKNKQAARLCRKRKLDNISNLEDTLTQMQEERNRLLEERKEIVAETEELKSGIDIICEMLMKGLNGQDLGLSELSVLHHSNGQTLLVQK